MRKLTKYRLDFSKTLDYFKDRMDGGNCLNNILLENIDLNKGSFFVLLPKKHNHNHLYDFKYGGILPSNPIGDIYIEVLNQTFKGERINSTSEELSLYISKLINNKKIIAVFDDVNSTYSENYHDPVFLSHGVHYKKEVYYVVTKARASAELIHKCIRYSNAFWHFLCILSEINFNDIIDKELTFNMIKKICINTKIIIIGAYDGEGYIFWEKN